MRSQQILDLLSSPPSEVTKGRAAFLAQQARRQTGPGAPTRRQARFLEEYAATPLPHAERYPHPAAGPLPRRKPGPLTPVELAWLNRFPTDLDPATVAPADVKALAAMDGSISPLDHPADSRLLRSVWAPVRDHHDAKAAEMAIASANHSLPPHPASTIGALADAISAENDQLTPEEAVQRAHAAIGAANQSREKKWAAAKEAAQGQQMAVDARVYDRTAVTP